MTDGEKSAYLEGGACILYLEMPVSGVIFLQSVFESYDGIGIVRTLDEKRGLVCVIAMRDTKKECLKVLQSLKTAVNWRWSETAGKIDDLLVY